MLSHVVIFWTKPGVTDATQRLLAGIETYLRPIPGVISLHVGTPVPSDRAVVDGSYQVGMVLQVADKATEVAYQKHPQHVAFVEGVFSNVCDRVKVYDFAG